MLLYCISLASVREYTAPRAVRHIGACGGSPYSPVFAGLSAHVIDTAGAAEADSVPRLASGATSPRSPRACQRHGFVPLFKFGGPVLADLDATGPQPSTSSS